MTRLSLVILYLFGLLWAVAAIVGLALPRMEIPELAGYERIVGIGLGWVETQALAGFGFALAAHACALGGRPGWAVLVWLTIVLVIALSVASLDPRLAAAVPAELQEPYNLLRAQLPLIRLGGFLGLMLIGAAGMLRREGRLSDALFARILPALVILAWVGIGWLGGAPALALLAFPALALLAMLAMQLAEGERPGGAHGFLAILVLLGGLAFLGGSGQRIDLAPAYLALPLLFVAGWRRGPDLRPPLIWAHALIVAGLVAWLSPAVSELIPRPPPTSLAEIRAALAGAEAARLNAGLALAALTLLGLTLFRRRRSDAPAPLPAAEGAGA